MGERIIPVGDLSCYDVVHSAWYELQPEVKEVFFFFRNYLCLPVLMTNGLTGCLSLCPLKV